MDADDDNEERCNEDKKGREDVADEDEDNKSHGTASYAAVGHGKVDMVRWLLRRGAKKDLLDGVSETPVDVAKRKGHTEILELLEKAK